MAKAVVPLRVWRRAFGSTRDAAVGEVLLGLFAGELFNGEKA